MTGKFTDSERRTGRRGFFRELLISAIDNVEKAAKQFADQRLSHFKEPPAVPPPPTPYPSHLNAQYRVYGPPWPPPYGPHVSIELRKKLDADCKVEREGTGTAVPRDAVSSGG